MPQELTAVLLIVGGSLISLYAFWQLVKRGLIFWVALLLVGAFLVQTSLQNPKLEMEDLLSDFKPKDVTSVSVKNLQTLCEKLD